MAMVNERFAQLIARKLSGEATQAELHELETLLKENPQSQYFFEVLSKYWDMNGEPENDSIQEDVHFQQILAIAEKGTGEPGELPLQPAKKAANVFQLKKLLVAAGIIGLIITAYVLIPRSGASAINTLAQTEIITAKPGARMYMLLPDGSKVWLNSESKLEYKKGFNDSVREVTLEGEGFFDVVKDKKHPFIVHTSDIDIRVLGTAFNVKSYPTESYIETTLLHGLIEVTNKKDPASPKVLLYPHDKLVFNKERRSPNKTVPLGNQELALSTAFEKTTLSKKIADSSLAETSWLYNKLLFDGETLRQSEAKLERWYNVNIHFRDDKVGNIPIRYPLSNETIEQALKALQYVEPFNYRINGNEIEIWRKRS
jgi:transmembrane sensor